MATPATVELVMFGIQAAMRLNAQFRRAYADSTRSLAITLPLPNFPAVPDVDSARDFYDTREGREFVAGNQRVHDILQKIENQQQPSLDERQGLLRLCSEHQALVWARAGILIKDARGEDTRGALSVGLTNEEISNLLTIRQWRPGEDTHPTMLRRMAGELINLGVEYLTQMPGVISPDSTRGKALRGFLSAVDSIDFAEDNRKEIIQGLFVAALETLRDVPEIVGGGEKAQILVQNVARGLYDDIKRRTDLAAGDLSAQEDIQSWGQLVFRSVLSSAGQTVLAAPDKFLGIGGQAEGELVKRVGKELLGIVLEENRVQLKNLLTQESLDRLAKAALAVVGDHPEIFGTSNPALKNLIGEIAGALSQSAVQIGKDFIPDAVRVILEETAKNFELLLPAGPNQPARHLLIVAAKDVLEQLAAAPGAGAKWTPRFGKSEALHVLEAVIEEVVQNPDWIEKKAGDAHSILGEVTKAVLDTLRNASAPRMSKNTALAILEAALRAAGKRAEFLAKDPANRRLIALSIEAVLATVFRPGADAKAAWVLARNETLERLVEIALEKLAQYGPSQQSIAKVQQVVGHMMEVISQNGKWSLELFSESLDAALAV